MIIETFKQYSDEWWEGRRGIPTASSFAKIVSGTGKKSKSNGDLAYRYASEIQSGITELSYMSAEMKAGTDREPEARHCYNFITGRTMEQIGMIFPDEKRQCGCSPDGIDLLDKRGLEIKCPLSGTQMKYLYENRIPPEHAAQVYGSLWICDELDSWDFMSYHPHLKIVIVNVTREDEGYKTYTAALEKYLPEFIKLVKKIAEV